MKKTAILLCVLLVLLLAGCSGGGDGSSTVKNNYPVIDPLNIIGQDVIGMKLSKAEQLFDAKKEESENYFTLDTKLLGYEAEVFVREEDGIIIGANYSIANSKNQEDFLDVEECEELYFDLCNALDDYFGDSDYAVTSGIIDGEYYYDSEYAAMLDANNFTEIESMNEHIMWEWQDREIHMDTLFDYTGTIGSKIFISIE
ncbi:hypothetical protein LJC20_00305 [Eubacteriales bacterium OttesenSCG-928-M02]|nr:hypothetical protein [Eubacteriales bacterium OttesenSCG-928-M02]